MKQIRNLTIFCLIGLLSFSCISNKKLIYLQEQDADKMVATSGDLKVHKYEDYKLQLNDVLDVNIRTTSPELNLLFNDSDASSNSNAMRGGLADGGDVYFMTGYTIDDEGFIELPVIGNLKVVGLTVEEAKTLVEEEVIQYVNSASDYFVRVRLGGMRYSALGEFNNPGKYTILQNRVTILEAIANAGEMTTVANRHEVTLIRQYPEGSKVYKINLLDERIMESDLYFLRPNDLIYAEPMKVRELGTGATFVQTFQLLVTTLTLGVLIYNATNNN
ncbi:polysaccharide biosynthesis/export family protein [Echinicola vietnamensis]|uniref:Periplasmic protein involved in polysaccharide export n=1 Tax=Echinicola vietnamensis (strain DSM 17526 / LMG 23754 / KMM 6221) TaxID=926556 RepID=L0G1N1_ECHVK|nr:polysaccharide biosynthesis/export family protein [Echinicola vietnamensis]AGA79213.1 periplasmic protein involved in polysaccharide export [Echinicola vietnamensis DSM 17526]